MHSMSYSHQAINKFALKLTILVLLRPEFIKEQRQRIKLALSFLFAYEIVTVFYCFHCTKMFISWFSILSAISVASALPVTGNLPVSVYPVRPYVFLSPELPKFTLQPAVKVQAPANIQPVQLTKSDLLAGNKQYVLVYPSYQYIATRQDGSSNSGFFETVQNFFVNFGNSQSDDSNQIMDSVEPDKPQSQPEAQPQQQQLESQSSTKSVFGSNNVGLENLNPTPNESKQKFVYSYITPASTVPLNSDRRLFFLAEQPQPILGSFSGSAINPVFNLQSVPVVLSRSNVAQPDEQQPNKVITENVQKFSQIPPVMASVEPTSQVQGKSNDNVESESIVVDALSENRIAPQPPVQPVEDNRALPIVTDLPAVVVAKSSAVPLSISNEPVAPVVAPVVGVVGNIEANDNQSVQPSLKVDVQPAVLPAVLPSAVVEQNVQGSQTVESVTGSV